MTEPPSQRPEDLLESVHDRETFMAFLWALVADREQAEQLERAEPKHYQWGGARRWQNSSISSFLGAAAFHFEDPGWASGKDIPSWRDLAQFLYCGKIYE